MWYIPLCLLLVVAFHQRWRVRTIGQSVWKGGGFGMFSDIEASFLVTEIEVQADGGGSVYLRIPRSFSGDIAKVPTKRQLYAFARRVAEQRWRQVGGRAQLQEITSAMSSLNVLSVTVRHFVLDFDARAGTYQALSGPRPLYRLEVKR